MNIHEHQAKEILTSFGVPIPRGQAAFSADEAIEIGKRFGTWPVVVKAQIHAGGRGKGGGVKLAKNESELAEHANAIFGMQLVTHQTGPYGKKVQRLLIEEGVDIARELYCGILLDRAQSKDVFMVSTEGGMDIEKVAEESPEKIVKVTIDPTVGFKPFHARQLCFALGLSGAALKAGVKMFTSLYTAYRRTDASLVEINPLVVTGDGRVIALDAKLNFDDNALHRQKEITAMRDLTEEDPAEVEAAKSNLNYVKLDGSIGCMVNGAGLAMATMDIIHLHGAEPANFLDVGGGANEESVSAALKIILTDKHVKAVLINIFGGIVRCDRVAEGVIAAAQRVDVHVPIIVRLEGNNADVAAKQLDEAGLDLISAKGLTDAAKKAVAAVK